MNDKLVLIVEDDIDISTFFSKALQSTGFMVETVFDGAAAEKRLGEIVPDVVILDLHLPLIGGIRLLEQIRADVRLSQTRVLVATANADLIDVVRNDADKILLKPIGIGVLRLAVEQLAG
jgi:DNA-binding response OmpR family regulator